MKEGPDDMGGSDRRYFRILLLYLPGITKENHEKLWTE
jgi:hypothetical protein